ncbi:MAG: non-canonical purine NTP pyrophosphatase, partial [Paludibacteraceae bacterium]|nr:non-canonical purine NTP pyrophosphatase [Paludibacteraceae bacterium]
MEQLVFATNNPHKVDEVRNKLSGLFEIRTLSEIGCVEDIPETSDTLQGNAAQKSHYLH